MRPPAAQSVTAPATKVSRNPYAGASLEQTEPRRRQSNVVAYVAIAFVAAVAIMYMRMRGSYGGSPTQTGPLVVLQPGASPDQSQIDNLTRSINALAGQVHIASPTPTGGASTPIVST